MNSCANCPNDAVYYVNDPGANPLFYCRRCLPPALQVRADSGQFPLPAEVKVVDAPAPDSGRRKPRPAAGD